MPRRTGGVPTMGSPFAAVDARVAQAAPKRVDPHYTSAEHTAWRDAVIRRAGGMCQWPGCGRTGVRLFADHVVELRDGGRPYDVTNGQALCGSHHTAKTAAARAARMARPTPGPPQG